MMRRIAPLTVAGPNCRAARWMRSRVRLDPGDLAAQLQRDEVRGAALAHEHVRDVVLQLAAAHELDRRQRQRLLGRVRGDGQKLPGDMPPMSPT